MNLTEYLDLHSETLYFMTNEEILSWLNAIPKKTMTEFLSCLSWSSQSKWFKPQLIADWYADLATKLDQGSDIPVSYLGNSDTERRIKIKLLCGKLMDKIVSSGFISATKQTIFLRLNDPTTISILLSLFIANGEISEVEKDLLTIEMSDRKRWESLGLTEPNIEKINTWRSS